MSDLHAALVAAVTARRELAETMVASKASGYVHASRRSGKSLYYRFMWANRPQQILRDTEAHLKILQRHTPGSQMPSGRRLCSCAHRYYTPYVEECDAIEDLAGIYPEVIGPGDTDAESAGLDSSTIH